MGASAFELFGRVFDVFFAHDFSFCYGVEDSQMQPGLASAGASFFLKRAYH
jgi:hypothetical protein